VATIRSFIKNYKDWLKSKIIPYWNLYGIFYKRYWFFIILSLYYLLRK
jgi:hypothetical protein